MTISVIVALAQNDDSMWTLIAFAIVVGVDKTRMMLTGLW